MPLGTGETINSDCYNINEISLTEMQHDTSGSNTVRINTSISQKSSLDTNKLHPEPLKHSNVIMSQASVNCHRNIKLIDANIHSQRRKELQNSL